MTKRDLARILSLVVGVPAAAVFAGCGPCPYTAVLEEKELDVGTDLACDAMKAENMSFEGPSIDVAYCQSACGDTKYNNCFMDSDYRNAFFAANPNGVGGFSGAGGGGGAGGGDTGEANCPAVGGTLTCQVTEARGEYHDGCPIPGRRPPCLTDVPVRYDEAGQFFATSAYFEGAAVAAFETLKDELGALGAPEDLLFDLEVAARDEVRHQRTMAKLARRFGAEPKTPEIGPRPVRSAEEIAIENAVEGLVNETFSAATALYQAEHAEDEAVRRALAEIADDECAHAALSTRIAAFLNALLDDAARARVDAARHRAIEAMSTTFQEPSEEVRRMCGVPSASSARAMFGRLRRALWGEQPTARKDSKVEETIAITHPS